MESIKPITALNREERRALAQAAADNGEQVHEACPFPADSPEHVDFLDDYLHRRRTLIPACA